MGRSHEHCPDLCEPMNCMDLAIKAAKGKLTDQEIMDAFDAEGKIREALIAAGLTDNLDARVASRVTQQALAKKIEAARMKRRVFSRCLCQRLLSAGSCRRR